MPQGSKGPAAVLPTAPAYTFGSKHGQVKIQGDAGPGPGEYPIKQLDGVSGHRRAAGTSFGSQPRLSGFSNFTPSPQDYDPSLKQARRSNPAFTLTGRKKADPLKQQAPGPGHYNVDKATAEVQRSTPAYSISFRWAGDKEAERRPGPQDYKPTQPSGGMTAPGVSIKARWTDKGQVDDGLGDMPGPGAYTPERRELPRGKSPPRYTFGVSRPQAKAETHKSPGPGDYDHASAAAKLSPYMQRAIGMPKAQRFAVGGQYEVRPGPGAYYKAALISRPGGHSLDSTRRSAPAATIGMKASPVYNKRSPGPGEYNCKTTAEPHSRQPAFTFRGVNVKDKKSKEPGPGHYQPDAGVDLIKPGHPAVSISHRHEAPTAQGRMPGPGEYDPALPGSPYAKVTMKFRHDAGAVANAAGEGSPGPHEFADGPLQHGALRRDGRKVTIGVRLKQKTQQDMTPGPGQYELHESTIGAATTGLRS